MALSYSESHTILGLPGNADDQEIRRAYAKLAMDHHPDHGGDPTAFLRISEAYKMLRSKGGRQDEQPSNVDTAEDKVNAYDPLMVGDTFARPREGIAQTAWMVSVGFNNEPQLYYWSYAHGNTLGAPIPRPPELMDAQRNDLYRNIDGIWTKIDRAPTYYEQYLAFLEQEELPTSLLQTLPQPLIPSKREALMRHRHDGAYKKHTIT